MTVDGFVQVQANALADTNLELIGTIDNLGTIDVDGGVTTSNLVIDGTVTLDGSGTVTLDGSRDLIVAASGGGTLDNFSTISGDGVIETIVRRAYSRQRDGRHYRRRYFGPNAYSRYRQSR